MTPTLHLRSVNLAHALLRMDRAMAYTPVSREALWAWEDVLAHLRDRLPKADMRVLDRLPLEADTDGDTIHD